MHKQVVEYRLSNELSIERMAELLELTTAEYELLEGGQLDIKAQGNLEERITALLEKDRRKRSSGGMIVGGSLNTGLAGIIGPNNTVEKLARLGNPFGGLFDNQQCYERSFGWHKKLMDSMGPFGAINNATRGFAFANYAQSTLLDRLAVPQPSFGLSAFFESQRTLVDQLATQRNSLAAFQSAFDWQTKFLASFPKVNAPITQQAWMKGFEPVTSIARQHSALYEGLAGMTAQLAQIFQPNRGLTSIMQAMASQQNLTRGLRPNGFDVFAGLSFAGMAQNDGTLEFLEVERKVLQRIVKEPGLQSVVTELVNEVLEPAEGQVEPDQQAEARSSKGFLSLSGWLADTFDLEPNEAEKLAARFVSLARWIVSLSLMILFATLNRMRDEEMQEQIEQQSEQVGDLQESIDQLTATVQPESSNTVIDEDSDQLSVAALLDESKLLPFPLGVLSSEVELRNAPEATEPICNIACVGQLIQVLETRMEWSHIAYFDSDTEEMESGWCLSDAVQLYD